MNREKKKKYNKIKLITSLVNLSVDLIFWILLLVTAIPQKIAGVSYQFAGFPLFQFYIFVAILGLFHLTLHFPLSFYSGYLVEHRFSLSNQSFNQWLGEQLKGMFVGLFLGGILITVFYILLWQYPDYWWFGMWLFMFLFSVILARFAPLILLSVFYKVKKLSDDSLRVKIENFARKWDLWVTDVFEFNLSKNTKKANAAITGLGKKKKILLADTLLHNFSEDEIESVFAHEMGHYVYHHLPKIVIYSGLISLIGLFLVHMIYQAITTSQGLATHQLEAIPYLGLLFFIFNLLTDPLINYLSRKHEYQADSFAIKTTGFKETFADSLKKLADLNLADEEPHPVVEFIFQSHPSIKNRIQKISEVTQ